MRPTLPPAAVVDPDRDTARQWAVEELTGQAYQRAQPGLVQQAIGWVLDRLGELLDAAGEASSGVGLLVGVAVLVVVVVLALLLAGPVARRARRRPGPEGGVFDGTRRTGAEHRRAAEQAAAAGRWAEAVQERFRATARGLEERVVLDTRPGRTAYEVAAEAGAVLPGTGDPLHRAARAFDDVTYGERSGDEAAYAACVEADDAVGRARPAATALRSGA